MTRGEIITTIEATIAAWDKFYLQMQPQNEAEDAEFGPILKARSLLTRLKEGENLYD